jgi:hypothetical protein
MAPTIRTSRDNRLVSTSVTNVLTRADDVFGLSGNDRIAGLPARGALTELRGPQRPFLAHARRPGIDGS